MSPFVADGLIPLAKILAVILYPMLMVIVMIWLERRVVAWIQGRVGPNRVGFQGILQPFADAVKLFFKEDIIQRRADRFLFNISPVLVMFSTLLAFCFLPLGESIRLGNYTLDLWVARSPVGLLLVLGLSSISVFGVIFGGWASNSKYPLMGALRSVVQVLSYEIPVGMTVLTVVFFARSMDLVRVIERQKEAGVWYGFMLPVSFLVFWISAIAETNRAPFDLPEAESELVAGYHTEYSGMKFAFFYMAEYAHMVLASSLVVILFFGGWLPPFPNVRAFAFLGAVPGFVWYLVKIMFFLYLYVWIRATFPRYRFDSLIRLVWKWLIPLAFVNFLAVVALRYLL
ncbi:MAG: NADH-quinone oxidoreductase subunit NuoH [Candidatus Aminicenantes bacterium]|nr:NADH-quinone oxidoreductase subunit NuoH [Candidatus Aminicenantes bacterium]